MFYTILSFNSSFIHDISHPAHFILSVSHHVTCAPSPLFYTLIGSLSNNPGLVHPGPCIFYIADQVFREDHSRYEKPKFRYLVVPSQYIVTLFYSCHFFLFSTLDFCSILSFICYHCVRCLYVILQ